MSLCVSSSFQLGDGDQVLSFRQGDYLVKEHKHTWAIPQHIHGAWFVDAGKGSDYSYSQYTREGIRKLQGAVSSAS